MIQPKRVHKLQQESNPFHKSFIFRHLCNINVYYEATLPPTNQFQGIMAPVQVIKHSGNRETFDEPKLRQSLKKADAGHSLIDEITASIRDGAYDGITTQEIYKQVKKQLRRHSKRAAGRYRLKEALQELGPTEVPFKKFITEILNQLGYETKPDVTALGNCITHNIDVIAQNDDAFIYVECRFFQRDERCSVRVPLYVQSQFEDLEKERASRGEKDNKIHKGWVVTNTRFSYDAEEYGRCVGLKLLSWDYPRKQGIKDLVEFLSLYPVTCLTSLTKEEKKQLIDHDILFCKQVIGDDKLLRSAGIHPRQMNRIASEANEICG